jgi:hypothetical protein
LASDKTVLLNAALEGRLWSANPESRIAGLASFFGPKITRLAATRHDDNDFKRLPPRQPAQALPDLRKARLAPLYAQRRAYLDLYARE